MAHSLARYTRRLSSDVMFSVCTLCYFATIHIYWMKTEERSAEKNGMRQCLLIAVCVRDYHMQSAHADASAVRPSNGCEITFREIQKRNAPYIFPPKLVILQRLCKPSKINKIIELVVGDDGVFNCHRPLNEPHAFKSYVRYVVW